MILSDFSVKRPVFASVIALLLVAFGIVSFERMSLREYPDIDPPVVSITTDYRGASASIIETRITQTIEDRISGVEGIKYIESSSEDGRSRITIEFDVNRDIDGAANDIRDRVSGVLDDLPEEADPPDIQKANSDDDVIVWLNLVSDRMSTLELTDYARRFLQDRFSVLSGVARVRLGGGLEYAMRVWLDRQKLAARNLTVQDVENALRAENVELPAGSIEAKDIQFTTRLKRLYTTPDQFENLVIAKTDDYLIRLKDVARVEKAAVENRTFFRGNGVPMIGLGIIKQSKANTIEVAKAAVDLAKAIQDDLPEGMKIINSYDTSVFVDGAIKEVYKTLFFALALVSLVIYLFLQNVRAMIIPVITVPISLMGTFTVLYAFGFSLNLLTLLGLVLAIGLVVDDAIVVLENISRRIDQGEDPLVAAYYGTRQVGFAVVATTIVLIAVFVPIAFLEGDLGRLFTEFSVTLTAAIIFSMFLALSLCSMLASKLLVARNMSNAPSPTSTSTKKDQDSKSLIDAKLPKVEAVTTLLDRVSRFYQTTLKHVLRHKAIVLGVGILIFIGNYALLQVIPKEYAPREDRGAFFVFVTAQEGATYNYIERYMTEIESIMMPYVEKKEINRLLVRAPREFGTISRFNDGIVINVLEPWGERRNAFVIMKEIAQKLSALPGVRAFPVMRQGFGGGTSKPVQFVIGGASYEDLLSYRNTILSKINENNPGLTGVDTDYKETQPQARVIINRDRAARLDVSVREIGETLETLFGTRTVTTFVDDGEEYDVILESEKELKADFSDLKNVYVRSLANGAIVPLSNLVTIEAFADSGTLNRYNRIRSVTIEANLEEGYTLGEALSYLRQIVRDNLPESVVIDYKGESLDFQSSQSSILFIFFLGILVVFLVLAAQFESYIHPFVIILSVPLTIFGALFGLWVTGNTLNIYTQVSLIILVGLAAKNGILIVEFANQLREEGHSFNRAVLRACRIRFRPIIMTSITTAAGAIPLIFAFGPGAESRTAIGIVIFSGVVASVFFTLFMIPCAYHAFARSTKTKDATAKRLEKVHHTKSE